MVLGDPVRLQRKQDGHLPEAGGQGIGESLGDRGIGHHRQVRPVLLDGAYGKDRHLRAGVGIRGLDGGQLLDTYGVHGIVLAGTTNVWVWDNSSIEYRPPMRPTPLARPE